MQRRSRARLGTVLALVVSLAALVPTGAVAATQSVTIALSSFSPSSKTIARGDTVQWRNEDHTTHDVKSDLPGYFSSPDGAGGMFFKDMYVKSFKQAGSFGYFCRAHKSTTPHEGTIVVPIKVTRDGNTFTIVAASQSMAGTKWRNRIQVKGTRFIDLEERQDDKRTVRDLLFHEERHVPLPFGDQGLGDGRNFRLEPGGIQVGVARNGSAGRTSAEGVSEGGWGIVALARVSGVVDGG